MNAGFDIWKTRLPEEEEARLEEEKKRWLEGVRAAVNRAKAEGKVLNIDELVGVDRSPVGSPKPGVPARYFPFERRVEAAISGWGLSAALLDLLVGRE